MSAETPFDTKDYGGLLADLLGSATRGAVPIDDHEGSVARTLLEAFARELAVCYEQLRRVYQFGYLDSAEGAALDKVVALLGIERLEAGHLEGTVTFTRSQPAPADILIPAGTLLAGRDAPVFATVEKDAMLPTGGLETSVKVRAVEPGGNRVATGQVTLMPRPIRGIDQVTNTAPLELSRREETDGELRERARYRLESTNRGTVRAIEQAIRSLGIAAVTVSEQPGKVTVILGDADISPALKKQAEDILGRVRPAGVPCEIKIAGRVYVQIAATLILREVAEDQKKRIRLGLEASLQAYFDSLTIGELVRAATIEGILNGPQEVASSGPLAGKKRLHAFVEQSGQLVDANNRYLMLNGDVQPGADERAALAVDKLPILLQLEPPALDVWVDAVFDQALTAQEEAQAKERLQVTLDTIKPGVGFAYEQLHPGNPALVAGRSVKRFTLIHQQDNLAVTLSPNGNQTVLRERERLRVGSLGAEQSGHG